MIPNQQAIDIFRDYLKKGNNRITQERFEVLDAVIEYEGHFSADELYIWMKNKNSSVSRATVYNTLEKLTQAGLVSMRNFGNSLNKYESNFKKQNHDHVVCLDCGRIVEFSDEKLTSIQKTICENLGFEPAFYSFNIFARCKDKKNCKFFHE